MPVSTKKDNVMPITIDSFCLTEEQKQNLLLVTTEQAQSPEFIKDGFVSPGYWLKHVKPSGRVIPELLCAGDFNTPTTLVEEQVAEQPLVEIPVVEQLVETPVVEQLVETPVVEKLVEAPEEVKEEPKEATLTEGTTEQSEELQAPPKPRGRKKAQ
jgi:hypothetical protein